MLNLHSYDSLDSELLEESYNAIRQKDQLEIITDGNEKDKIYNEVVETFEFPAKCSFTFQNLFRITRPSGFFYIAQCMLDFGYIATVKAGQTDYHKYNYQLIGIGRSVVDLGKTLMRPETKSDKVLGWLGNRDVQFKDAELFNKQYYLVSSDKEKVLKAFDSNFINVLSKYKDVHLLTREKTIFITFGSELEAGQSTIIENIFSNYKFLSE